jgi:hypothetical protein
MTVVVLSLPSDPVWGVPVRFSVMTLLDGSSEHARAGRTGSLNVARGA